MYAFPQLHTLKDNHVQEYIAFLVIVVVSSIFIRNNSKGRGPSTNLTWYDKREEIFSATRSRFRAFTNGRKIFSEAYIKYSNKGKVAIISTISIPLVMIPFDKRKWFFEQKKDVLDPRATGFDAVETHFTMPCGHILDTPTHTNIIKKNLTKELGNLTESLVDEVEIALRELWGSDTENWQEVVLWNTIIALVTRTFNRIAVDKPLCQNKQYLKNTQRYVSSIHGVSAILRVFPSWSKPVIGRLLSLPCWYYYWRGKQYVLPLIKEGLIEGWIEHETESDPKEHNVFLMWIIRTAIKAQNLPDLQPSIIYGRLMTMNFAGIHTSTFTIVNCLLDTLSHDQAFQRINEEVINTHLRHDGIWTKSGIDELKLVDSAIRESIRCSGPIVRLLREVVPEDGVDINGVIIPKGAKVAVDMHNMHLDSSIYHNAEEYDPYRLGPFGQHPMPSLVTTSEHFLGFGHGRTACPGRFFAAHEIKIIMSIIALRYDIEKFESRPTNLWMGDSLVPRSSIKLRVKRKPIEVLRH